MSAFQAYLIAILQGVTELFPVSSLGHAVILPSLFGWQIDQHGQSFLPFLVVLHLGTAAALLLYFWRDWIEFLLAIIGRPTSTPRAELLRLLALIVIATIPAGLLGLAFAEKLRGLFGAPPVAAIFLIVNGVLLFIGERLRRRATGQGNELAALGWRGALMIGVWQCTALIPGISRSGATMVGGLLAGLHHKESARFSFLIATPIIGAAGVHEVPKLLHHDATSSGITGLAIGAGVAAAITAYLSVAFLMRYFKTHDIEALDPFAWYCWAAGGLALLWIYGIL